ncbi:glucosidase [candidate division KSB1 bacterium]|nr:glucosidase [candidate division KSB1 bacterium]
MSSSASTVGAELRRLQECRDQGVPWKQWGPYLADRQWGTVREDYSPDGDAWAFLPHDHARSKAYRWGEDGIGGFSDDEQTLCLGLALWNGNDPIIKERFFGLTGPEGNHGEDVKEYYYYLDATPSHSYQRLLYKYPQREFPYAELARQNRRRTRQEHEYELIDTGIFADHRYFDVFIEYAKAAPDDLLLRVTAWNRGPDSARLHLLPHVWFRNDLTWTDATRRPVLRAVSADSISVYHHRLGEFVCYLDGSPDLLFCENETNYRRLYGLDRGGPFFKDGINNYLVHNHRAAVNHAGVGTKAAAGYEHRIGPGASATIHLRLTRAARSAPFADVAAVFDQRLAEADEFYDHIHAELTDSDMRRVQRQALAGMLWSKQYYAYDVTRWLEGDRDRPPPPESRKHGRNRDWPHVSVGDVISMPDKWEYPWFAAWDLAFHCIPLAMVDAEFAKQQLLLLTREWYMHPNGQLPAYEWQFGDVNPPVHAWATWRVYKVDKKANDGRGDLAFLERVYHKLLMNFTWWVNRKDAEGNNIFQGGFLGLDNIGVFDRSSALPTGGSLEQCDGTSWMAMYCLNMMRIALELSRVNPSYQDMATKFFEHFLRVAAALANLGGQGINLWDERDEFFYDVLHTPDHQLVPLRVRSIVGLIPLFAVETLEPDYLHTTPAFKQRVEWLMENRPELADLVSRWEQTGAGDRHLLSLLRGHRLKCLLRRMLDESEFLSPYGIRALSKIHEREPYHFHANGDTFTVAYRPGESDTGLFGGNSNWRGPVWFPLNYLIIESLQKFYHYYGPDFKVECPTHSGNYLTILEISEELTRRLGTIFLRDANGRRPVFGHHEQFHHDPHFRDHVPFYEYFHGDNGRGVGASHQTGWTGLIAKLLHPRKDREDIHAESAGGSAT